MKIFAALSGGLGNQMFQYAAARSLAQRVGAELVLDTWSGFVRDRQYRRTYELSALPIQGRSARPAERLPIWLYRWKHRGGLPPSQPVENHWYGSFLVETADTPKVGAGWNHPQRSFSHQPVFHQFAPHRSAWLVGYWQSPRYFEDIATSLQLELMPPAPAAANFRALGEELARSESVALGVRLYEESSNPGYHAFGGTLKGIPEIRSAIERLRSARPAARFYVFCTHRAPLLEQLQLPADTVFVTHDDGFGGTPETLWLLSRCQHHLFTNSSYYWWGAWLSAAVRGGEAQRIIAADNFINRDVLCASWGRF
jgi:hypothetical protein